MQLSHQLPPATSLRHACIHTAIMNQTSCIPYPMVVGMVLFTVRLSPLACLRAYL